MMASVLAITCSSSATSTLGLDGVAAGASDMRRVPKMNGARKGWKAMLLEANQLASGVPDNDTLGGALVAGRPQLFLAQPSPNSKKKMSLRSEEHTSELQSLRHLVCRLL